MANKRYNTPEQATSDWHIPLNENFDALDIDVEIRDNENALNDYEPMDGSKYLATDSGAVYLGDGSQWQYLGEITSREVQSGGEGGVYATPADNTFEAINEAVQNNHVVVLPPGDYSGNTTIQIDPNDNRVHWLIGYGAKLNYTGTETAIRITNNQNSDAGWKPTHIVGLNLSGPGEGTGVGIQIVDSFRHHIDKCRLNGFQYGIELRNEEMWSEGNKITNTDGGTCARWLKFSSAAETGGSGTDSFRHTVVKDCWIDVHGTYGIEMAETSAVYNSTFENLEFYEKASNVAAMRVCGKLQGTSIRKVTMEGQAAYNSAVLDFGQIGTPLVEVSGIETIGGGLEKYRNVENFRGSGIRVLGGVTVD